VRDDEVDAVQQGGCRAIGAGLDSQLLDHLLQVATGESAHLRAVDGDAVVELGVRPDDGTDRGIPLPEPLLGRLREVAEQCGAPFLLTAP